MRNRNKSQQTNRNNNQQQSSKMPSKANRAKKQPNVPVQNAGKRNTPKKISSAEILPPELDTKPVQEEFDKMCNKLNELSKENGRLSTIDIENAATILQANEHCQLRVVMILIDNKVPEQFCMKEAEFFKTQLGIEKSKLSRIKSCNRVLKTLFGTEYGTFPKVSNDALLVLHKIDKVSKKEQFNVDIKEIWTDAESISKRHGHKGVLTKDVREAAINILPAEVYDTIALKDARTSSKKTEPEVKLKQVVPLHLELGQTEYVLDLNDSKERVNQCKSIQSLAKAHEKVQGALDEFFDKMGSDESLNPLIMQNLNHSKELQELGERHQQELQELNDNLENYESGLRALEKFLEETIDARKRQRIKP